MSSEYWIGNFKSFLPATLLCGRVVIKFPYPLKDLPRGQSVVAEFVIRYDGLYKNNETHTYIITVSRGLDGRLDRIELTIAGKKIEYELHTELEDTIIGRYKIKFPPDEGEFQLTRNGPDEPVKLCVIS